MVINELIRDIPGALNISDVIVFGKTQAEHDAALKAVFRKLAEVNLTLNKKSVSSTKRASHFLGLCSQGKGFLLTPRRWKPLQMPNHHNDQWCELLPGNGHILCEVHPKFQWHLRTVTRVDKERCQVSLEWVTWAVVQQDQRATCQCQGNGILWPKQRNRIGHWCFSLGIICHPDAKHRNTSGKEDRPVVAYSSRALTDIERHYSPTEREALAIVWAVKRLHLYLYGCHFKLITDCKPVQLIFSNPKSKPPPCIEWWNLRLQGYDFEVVHTEGSQNPSDFLSRHSSLNADDKHDTLAEEYVNCLASAAVPKARTLAEIQEATAQDITMQSLADLIRTQSWRNIEKLPDNLEMLIMQNWIGSTSLTRADSQSWNQRHPSGQPYSRTCSPSRQSSIDCRWELLREKIWFPGIDDTVQRMVKKCIACQAT